MYTVLTKDRSIMHIVVPIFWLHFVIVTLWWPLYSPVSWIGKYLVSWQKPEYVWAIQKRFARGIWMIMWTLMMLTVFVFDVRGYLPLTICGICLLFMWLESAVGLCVGCKIYYRLVKKKYIREPEHRPACPWWACDLETMRKLHKKT